MSPEDRAEVEEIVARYVAELHAPRLSYQLPEAARLLGVDARTVRRLIASGRLAAERPSPRLTLIPRWSLYEFLGLIDQPTQVAVTG